jgi:site-specific DNA-methyltransferase (adenine-specific)
MELDRIYNEDCLEGMKRIDDGTVDAIICDLPYGTTACPWDSVIPFEPLWEQFKRVTKPNAAIVLFGSEPFSSALRMSNIKAFKYDWIWEKSKASNFLQASYMPMKAHETISVFCFGGKTKYNPIKRKGEPFNKGYRITKGDRPTQVYEDIPNIESYEIVNESGDRNPRSVIYFKTSESEGEVKHPTQKPVDLLRYLVLTYTNPNDVVLDATIGSGTTAIACIKEHRHFVGFELNKEYFDRAVKRINDERRQLSIF